MQPLLQQLTRESAVWDIGAGIGAISLHAAHGHRGNKRLLLRWDESFSTAATAQPLLP